MSNCYDCSVEKGELHITGCDVERCHDCGGQFISCGCSSMGDRIPWNGEWAGTAECREFGWYSKFIEDRGWVRCDKNDNGASEDLNRLAVEAVWDHKQNKYVKVGN